MNAKGIDIHSSTAVLSEAWAKLRDWASVAGRGWLLLLGSVAHASLKTTVHKSANVHFAKLCSLRLVSCTKSGERKEVQQEILLNVTATLYQILLGTLCQRGARREVPPFQSVYRLL